MRYLVILISFAFTGCASIYGIKEVKSYDTASINQFIKKENLSQYNNFVLDNRYSNYIKAEFKNYPDLAKYYLQPIQVFYFDKENSLVSYYVNCNAGGFGNLNWNKNNSFATYPPKSQTKTVKQLKPNDFTSFLSPAQVSLPFSFAKKEKVVVIYSLMLSKQSSALIKLVLSNLEKANGVPQVVLLNSDSFDE